MKISTFFTVFISIFVIFIFLHIHKRSNVLQLSYRKQKNEQRLKHLVQKKEELKQKLCALQDKNDIKIFAQNKLGFKKVRLNQIKKLVCNE